MPADNKCPECGAAIPSGVADGLCTQCLFSLGLEEPDTATPLPPPPDLAPLLAKSTTDLGVKFHYFGDYELLEEIARGGMGVVFRARQISLNRTVALKLITAGRLANKDAVKRFQLEAEAAARLDHPNIVPIYEIGQHEGHHFFTMKLLEGGSLAAVTRSRKNAPPSTSKEAATHLQHAATLVATVARAVHYAHQRGILHRDLKPGNILLDERGQPHITDFGLAKLMEEDSSLTHSGMVMGTPSYMSPEQAAGKNTELTTGSDLWSLGIILYELLTGQPPFRGATPMETLRQVTQEKPKVPSASNPAVDRDLSTICLKCLDKDPAGRYASAAALADDLERWLRRVPILARRAGVLERTSKWARRQPLLAAAVTLLQIVLIAGLAGIIWQWRQAIVARRAEVAERQRAVRAEADALGLLHEAKLNFVRANRLTGRLGQRFDSLAELARAAQRTNSLELRNEAIACLALPDLRPFKQWVKTPSWDSFRFSASHKRYMTNDASGKLQIRDVETDALLFQIAGQGAKDVASFMVSSPDDRFVATVDRGGQAHVWDASTQLTRVIELPRGASVQTFTPNSRGLVLKHADGLVHFLNATNGSDEKSFPRPANLHSVQFDASGSKFLSISEDRIIIHHASDGRHLKTISRPQGAQGSFQHAAWHPDCRRLVASWRNNIGFWDSETGRQLAMFEGQDGTVVGLAFSRTGEYLAIAAWDHVTALRHTETYREVLRLPESGRVLAISADNRWLSFTTWDNKRVKLYELADVRVEQRVALPLAPGKLAHFTIRAAFSPNNELVLASDSTAVYVFDPANPAIVELPVTGTLTGCFAPDGNALFTGGADGAKKWALTWSMDRSELRIGPPEVLAPTRGLHVEVVESSHDGQWLVAMDRKNGVALNLQMAPPYEVVRLDKALCPCFHLDLSPDGRWIASVTRSLDALQIWDARTGVLLTNIPSFGAWQCAFSRDGKWLAVGQKDSTKVLDTTDWRLRYRIEHRPHDGRHGVTFSPDGKILALFNSNVQQMRLIRLETGEELASFPVGLVTTAMRFNATGDRIAVANERGYVQLWDLRRVREQLAALHLDWNLPPYPPEQPAPAVAPLRVIVHANSPPAPAR
jgi:eukaryotic-like serine/threonine-protein kinase